MPVHVCETKDGIVVDGITFHTEILFWNILIDPLTAYKETISF